MRTATLVGLLGLAAVMALASPLASLTLSTSRGALHKAFRDRPGFAFRRRCTCLASGKL